ncbi:MAG: 30S ribosomal protein S18 [Verrucomicrobia bacterium]|nr:30S ribosomal protein S18 [Verrucomicrobiota bacterium]MBU6445952.1 30S ribosomal protein S18 [Verrucomicrobiota bacterium]MDE3047782.1 30S ribosomal protein S18 [Verrucomicrobiota bacterium]
MRRPSQTQQEYSNPSGAAGGGGEPSSPFAKRKKACPFVAAKAGHIDYKDLETLRQFITERGKILPRRITGVSYFYQKLLKKAIKQARHMALLPFVGEE